MDGTTEDGQNQENDRPFGEMKPTRGLAFITSITRRLPVWIPRRVVYALRRLVKRNLPHAVDAQRRMVAIRQIILRSMFQPHLSHTNR